MNKKDWKRAIQKFDTVPAFDYPSLQVMTFRLTQKQSFADVLQSRFSWQFRKFHSLFLKKL